MKNKIIVLVTSSLLLAASCKKEEKTDPMSFETLKTSVIQDFTDNVALKTYNDLNNAAVELNTSILMLNTNTSEGNLTKAKADWKKMRKVWEQSEGFLFGPVSDRDYDPRMDTWPTDYNELDNLIKGSNPLEYADIEKLENNSLRGFHPLEYILFGISGSRPAADFSDREKIYMVSLSEDLKRTCQALYDAWTSGTDNYASKVRFAGDGTGLYKKKQDVYFALVDGMNGICLEVGGGKIFDPYTAMDSTIVESPYSGTSMVDFRYNIVGLQNVYLGHYENNKGSSMSDLVASKNKALDNKLKDRIAASIAKMDNITVPFEMAIFTQRVQTNDIMIALDSLHLTIENELRPFIQQNIKD